MAACIYMVYEKVYEMSMQEIFKLILAAVRKAAVDQPIRVHDCWNWKASIRLNEFLITVTSYKICIKRHHETAFYSPKLFESVSLEELTLNFFLLFNTNLKPKEFFK